jgi:SEC-C motif-containing protein
MRSRYSGYFFHLADYIIKTTHPKNSGYKNDTKLWREDILHFCTSTRLKSLEILDVWDGKDKASVTFKITYLSSDGKEGSFTEKSYFEKVTDQWLYLSGEFIYS